MPNAAIASSGTAKTASAATASPNACQGAEGQVGIGGTDQRPLVSIAEWSWRNAVSGLCWSRFSDRLLVTDVFNGRPSQVFERPGDDGPRRLLGLSAPLDRSGAQLDLGNRHSVWDSSPLQGAQVGA